MPHERTLCRAVSPLLFTMGLLLLFPPRLHAQGEPPWKTAGNPFFGNPGGYARSLYGQYTASQAELTRLKGSLAAVNSELEPYRNTGLMGGIAAGYNDAQTLIQKKDLQRRIAAEEQKQRELVRDWDEWCHFGLLLGSLTDANETIEDTYLDKSVFPPALRKCLMDRVAYRIKYFLEGKTTPSAAGGGGGGAAFPADPFNGLQITYSISGAALSTPSDGGPFEGLVRSYGGSLQGGTLRVTGTVTMRCDKDYPGDATIDVWAGDQKADQTVHLDSAAPASVTRPYDVSVKVPPDATSGGVTVNLPRLFGNGEFRFVRVDGRFDGMAPAGGAPASPAPGAQEPRGPATEPGQPPASEEGRLYILSKPAQFVAAGAADAAAVDLPTGVPMKWGAGDRIITAPDSPAVLVFPDSIRSVVSGGTRLILQDGALSLDVGSAYLDLLPRDSDFRVQTPAAIVTSDGAAFATQAQEDGATLVAVLRGQVRVADRAGRSEATIEAGQVSGVSRDGEIPAPQALTEDQIDKLFSREVTVLESPLPAPGDVLGEPTQPPGGVAEPAPAAPAGPAPVRAPAGGPADVGGLTVGTDVTDGQVVGAADRFSKAGRVSTAYEFADVPEDTPCEIIWSRNGKEILKDSRTIGGSGSVSFDISMVGDNTLPRGTYTVTITVDGKVVGRKTFTVAE